LATSNSTSRASRRGSGGITLAHVARLAGVSAITVSRALNTPDRVSPATLAQVRDAVHRTGYVPNLLAGGLASNRSRLVAALVPTIAGSVFLDTIQAGVVYVNRRAGATTGAWPGIQSFGGWKGSGSSGKGGLGPYYVQQFLREQSQTVVGD